MSRKDFAMERQMQLQKAHIAATIGVPHLSPATAEAQRALPRQSPASSIGTLTGTRGPRFNLHTVAIFPSAVPEVEPTRIGSAWPLVVQRQEISLSRDKLSDKVGQQIRQRIQAACGRGDPLEENIQHKLEGHLHTDLFEGACTYRC